MKNFARLLVLLLILVAASYLGLWWWAEGQMADALTQTVKNITANGLYTETDDGITRGTSPLTASATINNLRLTIQDPKIPQGITLTIPSVALFINASQPTLLNLTWPSQIGISTPKGDVAITFGSAVETATLDMHAVLNREPYPINSANFSATDVNVLASSGSLRVLHVDSISGSLSLNRDATAQQTAYQFSETFNNLALAPLITRIGSIPFNGTITQFGVAGAISGPVPADLMAIRSQIMALPADDQAGRSQLLLQAVHEWAAAGGHATGSTTLTIGPSTLNASGSVAFDQTAQPSGKADVTANHLDEFTGAITNAYPQTQDSISQAEAQFSPYLTSTDSGGQTLTLHITYGPNGVSLNGQPPTPMPPLNWDQLLAPPPAPAQGDGSGAAGAGQ
jgi:hypothetical protein